MLQFSRWIRVQTGYGFWGDLKLVSTAAGNWRSGESQYKVHTFLQ